MAYRTDYMTPTERGAQSLMNAEKKEKKKSAESICRQCRFRNRAAIVQGNLSCNWGLKTAHNFCEVYQFDMDLKNND